MELKGFTLQQIYDWACESNMQNAYLTLDFSNVTLLIPGTDAELHVVDMDNDCPVNCVHFFKSKNYCAPEEYQNSAIISLEYVTPDNQKYHGSSDWEEEKDYDLSNEIEYQCSYMTKTYY